MRSLFDDADQKTLYTLIVNDPGIYISKLAESMGLSIAEIQHHLNILQNKGLISVTTSQGYNRYFIKKQELKTRDKRSTITQNEIYCLVQNHPGLYLSKIAEMLEMSVPLADYHLDTLRKTGKILVKKDPKGYYKRYFVADHEVRDNEKILLSMLRKKIPLQIILFLLKDPMLQHKDMLKLLDISSSTLSYHLTNLAETGIVEAKPHGREKGYHLVDANEIIRILQKYEIHIELHQVINRFEDLWEGFSYSDILKK